MGKPQKKTSAAKKHAQARGRKTAPRLPLLVGGFCVLALVAALLLFRPWQRQLTLPEVTATSVVVLDAGDGSVLYEKNADTPRPPSSLTKLMTAYLILEDIGGGHLSLTDTYRITPAEADTPGSKYGLHPGMTLTVEQLLAGVILNSGCDCVQSLVALSADSEDAFVARMNDMAADMKLKGTHFSNATGLDSADHYMTAMDLAQLSYRLISDHPEYLDYSAQPAMEIDGLSFENLNLLVGRDPRVQGLKTGTTSIGGNSLVTYAVWEDKAYLIVLLDSASEQRRFAEARTLLDALCGEVSDGQS